MNGNIIISKGFKIYSKADIVANIVNQKEQHETHVNGLNCKNLNFLLAHKNGKTSLVSIIAIADGTTNRKSIINICSTKYIF